jgi:hypothetical protein
MSSKAVVRLELAAMAMKYCKEEKAMETGDESFSVDITRPF